MRNLKRALSLGLTATMISGLMVMGSSAASYADVTSKQNEEAIEVLKTVGIMVGDENGKFNPEAKVTRNEMAVVMCNLLDYTVASYKGTSPFTDVPEWAEPYVAACYTNGITSGYDAKTYGGSDTVTTGQAALMLLKALGYFQYSADFGSDWLVETTKNGSTAGLFDGVATGAKEALTRNDVAQMVLNALEADLVKAEKNGSDVQVGDIVISGGKATYDSRTGTDSKYAKIDSTKVDGKYTIQLGEDLYDGDLVKADGADDDFGRPSVKWTYENKEIGTFADKADYVFTDSVTSKELYDAVGKTATGDKYGWHVAVDGDYVDYDGADLYANRNDNDADFAEKAGLDELTGNGVITEVFVDGTADEESVHVAVINQYAAEVLKVDEDDKTITLSDLDNGPAKTSDTFDTDDFAEDDIVVYTYAEGEIQSVYAAEKLEGEVTRVRSNTEDGETRNGDNFVVDGTTYKYNATVSGAERLTSDAVSNDVVAYLDANGYVVYIDESAVSYDYAYVLTMGTDGDKFDNSDDDSKSETVYARLILTDGTIVKVETDAKKSEINGLRNQLVAYSVDKNDIYTLTVKGVAAADTADAISDVKIENGKAGFSAYKAANTYSANSNTVFIVVDSDDKYDDYDVTVYTGIKNVPDIDAIAGKTVSAVALDNKGAVAKVVYIEDGDISGTEQVIYAIANENAKIQKDSENGEYYEITAVVNGEIKTLNVKAGSNSAVEALVKNIDTTNAARIGTSSKYVVALKSITENADGFVTSAKVYEKLDSDNDGVLDTSSKLYVTGTKKAEDGTVGLANKYYAYSDDVIVARWNLDDQDVEMSRINSVKNDTNDVAIAIMDGNTVIGLFIIENKGGEEAASKDASISNVKMFGAEVKNGKVTVPGSANGAGEQRVSFDLAAGASVTKVSYKENSGDTWTNWNDDWKLTANLGQSKLFVKIETVAADGVTTGSYEFEATLNAAYTMTVSNTSSAAVRVSVAGGETQTLAATNGSMSTQVGAEGTTLTLKVSGGAAVKVTATNAQVWDNGDGTYEISDVTGNCTVSIANG